MLRKRKGFNDTSHTSGKQKDQEPKHTKTAKHEDEAAPPKLSGPHLSLLPNPSPAETPFFTFGGTVSQISPQPCPAPPSAVSPDAEHSEWHQGTDPSQDRHEEKLCFLSCQAWRTSVTRSSAGQMGFPFASEGEISVQSRDLLQGIPCRVLATNPAGSSTAAARSLLFPLVIHPIWVPGFEGINKNLPSYNLAFYFFLPRIIQ